MGYYRILWDTTGYYGILWDTMGYYGILLDTMGYYEKILRSLSLAWYPLPVAPLISRFADSAVLLKRRPKTLPQLPRGSVYIIYESIQRLEA